MKNTPAGIYLSLTEEYRTKNKNYEQRLKLLSNLRLTVFFMMFFFTGWGLYYKSNFVILWSGLLGIPLFAILVNRCSKLNYHKEHVSELIKINQKSIERTNHKWACFDESGNDYKNSEHPYVVDLDIFGEGSLYQWINVTKTFLGSLKLKKYLENLFKNKKEIEMRQKAVSELSDKLAWRQNFEAAGKRCIEKDTDPVSLFEWAESGEYLIKGRVISFLFVLLPFITFVSIIFFSISSKYPASLGFVGVVFQMTMAQYKKKKFRDVMGIATRNKDIIKAYEELSVQIEIEKFESELLKINQQKLYSEKKVQASKQIGKLDSIIDWMGLRFSGIYFIIDSLFFWDFHCVRALEKWKKNSGKSLNKWLDAIAEFEVLSSIAILNHDNPDWNFPSISSEKYEFEATEIGHPLLSVEERVSNDLSFRNEGTILMITGSNMSGKSTMLRTVALNLVLAYLGAPVCAKALKCSIMDIYTSMRTSDNLEKNISSFYAELLRIKMILEAASQGRNMIFFLDELFKGTNSRDRKIGAETVMKTLAKAKVTGFVSTHDLELAEIESDNDIKLENYYFKEHYVDQKIKFDYKMRAGVSNTSDAIYLMKMIGLKV